MTPLQRSASEEVAADQVGGALTRREAIRQLGLLSAAVVSPPIFIGACGNAHANPNGWAEADADAFVDFTAKPDGDPPSALDTGQAVGYTLPPPSNWKPQLSAGQLVHGTLPDSGSFADYYQARLDDDCRAFGARWLVDSNDGSSTDGVMCIAAWADTFQGSGSAVPRTPGHITITTVTHAWAWWVNDGGGPGANHLKVVKMGTFDAPASDGVTEWEIAVYIDADNGIGHLYLPGNDVATGTPYVTVTDTEIATALAAQNTPTTTFAATLMGADVVMVEHYANAAAKTARYPRFLSMWGDHSRAIWPARAAGTFPAAGLP